jgi:hypothetical protein
VEEPVEGEVVSRREALRRVQVDHLRSRIIDDINERMTRSRSRNASHFAHSAFVATFEPKDIGHALSDPNWVNGKHEVFENFERNQVWELVEPPPNCKPIGTNCKPSSSSKPFYIEKARRILIACKWAT